MNNILPYYILVGLIYALFNGFIRKIDTDDNPMLPLVWWFLWWLCLLGRGIAYIQDKIIKRKL
jgi:hypothetical protein